jgi:hypothetical protein
MFLAAACASSTGNAIDASLENNFALRVGQSALLASEDLQIGFQEVSGDSRCGKGVVCVWEGDATVSIWVHRSGGDREVHELHTARSQGPGAVNHDGLSIRLVGLSPVPVAGRGIPPSDYVATFFISRSSAGSDEIV